MSSFLVGNGEDLLLVVTEDRVWNLLRVLRMNSPSTERVLLHLSTLAVGACKENPWNPQSSWTVQSLAMNVILAARRMGAVNTVR